MTTTEQQGAITMNTPDETPSVEDADLVVSGSVAALRELAEPRALTDPQLNIIHWYSELARAFRGPRTGDERGPAREPSWVRQPPRIKSVKMVAEATPAYLVEGTGFATTTQVLIDGRTTTGWQVLGQDRLLIPVGQEPSGAVEIVVRTSEGDVGASVTEAPTPRRGGRRS